MKVKSISWREAIRNESESLLANAKTALNHSGAKGDGRESLLRSVLQRHLGANFGVTKGEIVDSRGKGTGEIDLIVYDRRAGACVVEFGGRRVIRVESVVCTVEVKSTLQTKDLEDLFHHQNKELLQLMRFYRPTPMLDLVTRFKKSIEDTGRILQKEGVSPFTHYENIPSIPSFVFAYDGISTATAAGQLQFPGVDVICVLGKYTIAKNNLGFFTNPPDLVQWAEGADALGGFLFLVEQAVERFTEASAFVRPFWQNYFMPMHHINTSK